MKIQRLTIFSAAFLIGLCISCSKEDENAKKRVHLSKAADGKYYSIECIKQTGATDTCEREITRSATRGRMATHINYAFYEEYSLTILHDYQPQQVCGYFGNTWQNQNDCSGFWGFPPIPEPPPYGWCDIGYLPQPQGNYFNSPPPPPGCGEIPWDLPPPQDFGGYDPYGGSVVAELVIDRPQQINQSGVVSSVTYTLTVNSSPQYQAHLVGSQGTLTKKECGSNGCRVADLQPVPPEIFDYIVDLTYQLPPEVLPLPSADVQCMALPTQSRFYTAMDGIMIASRAFPCGAPFIPQDPAAREIVRWLNKLTGTRFNVE